MLRVQIPVPLSLGVPLDHALKFDYLSGHLLSKEILIALLVANGYRAVWGGHRFKIEVLVEVASFYGLVFLCLGEQRLWLVLLPSHIDRLQLGKLGQSHLLLNFFDVKSFFSEDFVKDGVARMALL